MFLNSLSVFICIYRAPFLGQGANQALVDAFLLSQLINQYNHLSSASSAASFPRCSEYLGQRLEQQRKVSTILLAVKSNILGQIETFSGDLGMFVKEWFFRIVALIGIPQREYVTNSNPKIWLLQESESREEA